MSSILLVGGGGHCLTVLDSMLPTIYQTIGIIDLHENVGKIFHGVSVIGTDLDIPALRNQYTYAFISLGSVGGWEKRRELLEKVEAAAYEIPSIVHPRAIISISAKVARGVLIGPGAMVNSLANIGELCILNTGCIVEHQCRLYPYVHIAPGAVLCGEVIIGEGSHIGANSVVRQHVTIGRNVLIGMGSVVTDDIPDNVVAYGNPCKIIRKREEV